MTAVITGGTSFLGHALIGELLDNGETCYALVRPGSPNLSALPTGDPRLKVIPCTLTEPAEWMRAVPGCDVFYHLAWGGAGAEGRADPLIQRANVEMAVTCLRAAGEIGAKRFLFTGSQAEYGPSDDPLDEEHPCEPMNEYGRGKLAFLRRAREMCAGMDLEYVHMRIFSLYGPGDHPTTLVARCVETFLRDGHMPLSSCEQLWNFLHVEDAARLIRLLAGADLSGHQIFNVAGEDTRPLREFVDAIWTLCGKRGSLGFGEYRNAFEKPYGINPVIGRIATATHWRQRIPFEQGIEDLIDRFKG